MTTAKIKPRLQTSLPLIFLLFFTLFIPVYIGLRYDWRWLNGDAIKLAYSAQATYDQAALTDIPGAYQFGYTYPALNVYLSHITGLSIDTLQVFVQPFLVLALIPLAYVTFLELTGVRLAAFLAVFLLFMQPEFLFESLRSSHGKFTLLLALGVLFVLAASLKRPGGGWGAARWVLVFYLVAYALIASNFFFASSYIFSIALAFLGGSLLGLWQRRSLSGKNRLQRFLLVTLSCSILVFLFVFTLYPPAIAALYDLVRVGDRLAAFLLGVEGTTNPYAYVSATWISNGVYLALTLMSWLVLGISFIKWLVMAHKLLIRRQELELHELLLWLLYAAFVFLMVISVIADLAGALSANMQVRVFPNLMLVAIPLASLGIIDFLHYVQNRSVASRWVVLALVIILPMFFSVSSLLKVTNEPLLSNYWSFSTPSDHGALIWAGDHLQEALIWSGLDRRLDTLSETVPTWEENSIYPYGGRQIYESTLYYLTPSGYDEQVARLGATSPNLPSQIKIFDNGTNALYMRRALTPYQR